MTRIILVRAQLCLSMTILFGCASAPVNKTHPLTMGSVTSGDEPCWVRAPDCLAKESADFSYFVGQSEAPFASWGRPDRSSFKSAQEDAEQQYARFLGVDIESSTFMQTLLTDAHYQSQFDHTVHTSVQRTVSDLVKSDTYFVAHQETSEGEPLWTVYVLLKVANTDVASHRKRIAEESKQQKLVEREKAAAEKAAQAKAERDRLERAKLESSNPQWVAEVHNIDDSAHVYVNGQHIRECGFSQSCTVKLSPHFVAGMNTVRLEYRNHIGLWTYGYEILKGKEVMYQGRCGQVWVYGCQYWNTDKGVIHTFEFKVPMPQEKTSAKQ